MADHDIARHPHIRVSGPGPFQDRQPPGRLQRDVLKRDRRCRQSQHLCLPRPPFRGHPHGREGLHTDLPKAGAGVADLEACARLTAVIHPRSAIATGLDLVERHKGRGRRRPAYRHKHLRTPAIAGDIEALGDLRTPRGRKIKSRRQPRAWGGSVDLLLTC